MSGPVWQRIKAPLIELSLTCTEAEPHQQCWELRLEGNTLELKAIDESGQKVAAVRFFRVGREIVLQD
jgi:hypothetical protein